jgi:hypothetical protein
MRPHAKLASLLIQWQFDERKYIHYLLTLPVLGREIKVKTTGDSMLQTTEVTVNHVSSEITRLDTLQLSENRDISYEPCIG